MMSQLRSAVLVSVLILGVPGFATSASAVPMQAVYQGTISGGEDQFNLFEQGVSSLDGLSFVLTYLYDASTPGAYRNTQANFDFVQGGTNYGTTNPVQSVSLKIGSHIEIVSSNFDGAAVNSNESASGGSFAYSFRSMQDNSDDGTTSINDLVYANAYDDLLLIPIDLDTPFAIAASLLDSYGYFQFVHYDYATFQHTTYTYGNLNPTSLTVTQVEAVPLPAALPLFAAGIGAMGFMGWRRKRGSKIPT